MPTEMIDSNFVFFKVDLILDHPFENWKTPFGNPTLKNTHLDSWKKSFELSGEAGTTAITDDVVGDNEIDAQRDPQWVW